MIKNYFYKVYRNSAQTINNRVTDGDFEIETSKYFNPTQYWDNFWQPFGSGSTVTRSRLDSYVGSPAGTAMAFNGLSSYVQIPYRGVNSHAVNKNLTVTGWFYMSNWNDGVIRALVSHHDPNDPGTPNNGYGIYVNQVAGKLSGFVGFSTAGAAQPQYALTSLSAGWHHVALRYDGVLTIDLLVDGAVVNSVTSPATSGSSISYGTNGSLQPLLFGAETGQTSANYSKWFLGSIDDVAIYETNLSTANILSAATDRTLVQITNTPADLIDFLNFEDAPLATATTTFDFPSNSYANLKNVTPTTGIVGVHQCAKVVTSTGGATTQGIGSTTAGRVPITGGNTYTATAYVKGPAGATATLRIVPFGGGSSQDSTITLNGQWQRIINTYVSNVAATTLETDIFLNNANASVQTLYVDAVMLEDGATAHAYFNRYTPNAAGARYAWDSVNLIHVATLASYAYNTTWQTEVTSDFKRSLEINTAGSQVVVTLARAADNFGERNDVDFGNRVMVYVQSDAFPNGQLIFVGSIVDYTPIYGQNEAIDVTLFGYGSELHQTMIESAENKYQFQEDASGVSRGFGNNLSTPAYIGQGITTGSDQTDINSIEVFMASNLNLSSQPYNPTIRLSVWDNYANAQTDQWGSVGKIPIAYALVTLSGNTPGWYKFSFLDTSGNPAPIRVSPNQQLWFTLVSSIGTGSGEPTPATVLSSDYNPYSGGYMFRMESGVGGGNTEYKASDLCFRINTSYGQTKVAYNSMDPSTILKRILDDYARQGGTLSYDSSSIDMTGTVVSYTFQTNTTFEGLQQCLALAPVGWYFYIDEATNKVHFHSVTTAAVNTFTLGQDIQSLQFEKRTEGIVNAVYFTGGPDPSNPSQNLYRRYQANASIALYGKRLLKVQDNRVTQSSTMDIMAYASMQPQPEVRTSVTIEDGNPTLPLEGLLLGTQAQFRGFSNGPSSLWDVATWDQSYWDFDVATPETLLIQIVRYDYTPDSINMVLSTVPPDVNKRVEDIKRNLDTTQVQNNPSTPTSISVVG